MHRDNDNDWLAPYRHLTIVADVEPGHIIIGKLIEFSSDHLLLSDADLHDCRSANSIKEVYISEAGSFGININRREVAIPRSRLIAISKLADADITV